MLERMSSVVFAQTNGLGFELLMSRYCWIACSSCRVERCVPRRMYFSVNVANQRSNSQVNRQDAWDVSGFDGTSWDAKSLSLQRNRVVLGCSETPWNDVDSLPLDGRGRLARHVVGHAVDATDFVDDAARDFLQQAVRQLGPVGGHEIAGLHGTQGHHMVVSAAIAHH